MKFIADLEIHSRYARACSPNLTIQNIAVWAAKKGLSVMGTGDFTHPAWMREINEMLESAEKGLYKLTKRAASPYTKPPQGLAAAILMYIQYTDGYE